MDTKTALKRMLYFIIYYFSFFYAFNLFNIGNSVLISAVKEGLILVCFLTILFSNGFKISISKGYFGAILFYVLIIAFGFVRATSISYAFIDLKYYLIWPLIIYIVIHTIKTYDDYKDLLKHINIIAAIIGIIGVYAYIYQVPLLTKWRSGFQIYAPKSILSTAFDYGAFMAVVVLCNLVTLRYEKLKMTRLLLIIFFSINVFISYTRGSYLCWIIAVYFIARTYIVKLLPENRAKPFTTFVFDMVVVALGVYIVVTLSEDATEGVFSASSLLARINNVWPNMKVDSFFIGGGFGTVGRSANATATYNVSDNSYLRTILTMGIVGLLAMLNVLRIFLKKSKDHYMMLALYVSVGCTAFVSDFIVFTPAMLISYCLIGVFTNISPEFPNGEYQSREYLEAGGGDL